MFYHSKKMKNGKHMQGLRPSPLAVQKWLMSFLAHRRADYLAHRRVDFTTGAHRIIQERERNRCKILHQFMPNKKLNPPWERRRKRKEKGRSRLGSQATGEGWIDSWISPVHTWHSLLNESTDDCSPKAESGPETLEHCLEALMQTKLSSSIAST